MDLILENRVGLLVAFPTAYTPRCPWISCWRRRSWTSSTTPSGSGRSTPREDSRLPTRALLGPGVRDRRRRGEPALLREAKLRQDLGSILLDKRRSDSRPRSDRRCCHDGRRFRSVSILEECMDRFGGWSRVFGIRGSTPSPRGRAKPQPQCTTTILPAPRGRAKSRCLRPPRRAPTCSGRRSHDDSRGESGQVG